MRYGILLAFAVLATVGIFVFIQLLLTSNNGTPATTTPSVATSTKTTHSSLPLGQHFMIGHWANTPVASTTALIKKHQLAGVIIMSAPENPDEIKNWTKEWQEVVDYPLIIAIDQEGGEVSRLRGPAFDTTAQRDINSEQEAYALGVKRGQELSKLGINMNFAPVIDTAESSTSFMYARSFNDRKNIPIFASAMIDGMSMSDVIAASKHFPGHGDTVDDSHHTLPHVDISTSSLNTFTNSWQELFRINKPKALMTAHVLYPNIDTRPATLSSYFLTTYLRNTLQYEGLIITDDMSMDAIDTTWTSTEASKVALNAGADIILFAAIPSDITNTLNTLNKENIDLSLSDDRMLRFWNN